MNYASLLFARVVPMPTSVSPSARKGFDYASLDTETSQFVQQQTGQIRVLMKRTAQGIIEVGQKLIEVKKRLGHGRFGDWLEAEFGWGKSTANRFMNVALNFPKLGNLDNFAPSALYLLSETSTPEVVRAEALTRAEAGEPITYTAAKAIKQKYATPASKSKPESELEPKPASPPQPFQTTQSGSKLEIVAIRPQAQAQALEEATTAIILHAVQPLSVPQPSAYTPEQSGIWWKLGGRHLIYCGDPNSPEFLGQIPAKVGLLLAFPPAADWHSKISAEARMLATEYLPQCKNPNLLDEILELNLLYHSKVGDLVVSCFIPSPEILSIINRLERRGLFAEPDARRVNAVISDWKTAGLKAERLS